jgi:hypothetical protein
LSRHCRRSSPFPFGCHRPRTLLSQRLRLVERKPLSGLDGATPTNAIVLCLPRELGGSLDVKALIALCLLLVPSGAHAAADGPVGVYYETGQASADGRFLPGGLLRYFANGRFELHARRMGRMHPY